MGNVVAMGYSSSAEAEAPPQDDYVQRLSADDLKRYTEGFRRVCRVDNSANNDAMGGGMPPTPATSTLPPKPRRSLGGGANNNSSSVNPVHSVGVGVSNGVGISKKLFRSKLLSAFPLIPQSLSDRLFEVLDTDQRGELSVETILRGIALLKHGTRDEHLQLLFTIYDLDATGLVARDVLDRFMDVVYGRKKARGPTTVELLNQVFNGRATLTMEEFKAVAEEKDALGHAVLLEWLYVLSDKIGRVDDEQIVALERKYNPVVIRHRIAETTHFSTSEVSTLEKQFHKLFDTKGGASNRIPKEQFIDLLSQHEFPHHVLERACKERRLAVPGMVLFDEFCQVLSNFCRGMPQAKSQRLFEIFGDSTSATIERRIFADGIDSMLRPLLTDQRETAAALEAVAPVSGWIEEEFVEWASASPAVQELLHRMAFAACILFGIKPDSANLEKKIIEWHWKQASDHVAVGQTWNLLASRWWLQWCKFAGMDDCNGTPRGITLTIPQVPRDAMLGSGEGEDNSPTAQIIHASRPGTIANWSLLKRSGSRRLREKLVIGRDFHLVPSSVYSLLSQWYSGGPELSRSVVELANNVKVVEVFPLVLRVARVDSATGSVIMSGEEVVLSALSTVDSLLRATCKALLLTKYVEKARLWYFDENHPDHKYRLRSTKPKELKKLTTTSVFLVEIQDDDGSWPLSQISRDGRGVLDDDTTEDEDDSVDFVQTSNADASSRKRGQDAKLNVSSPVRRPSDICSRGNLETLTALASTKGSSANASAGVAPLKPASNVVEEEGLATARTLKRRFSRNAFTGSGLVGLDNLGNTCYMSSALQCLSHTRLLVDYFKNEDYLHDINLYNRDGTNGKLAVAFGELLRVLWTSEKKRFAPTEFKRVLARFNPQFSGSDQHDAQELLACLLSGLSEDLNRIVKKPYTEQPDSDGRCDAVVATEWWQNHLKREFSVIVALFTGQYKSLLECSVCHYESARFEPFTFLQLSLPESSYRSIVVSVIFNNGRVPMRYSVRVRNDGTIQDLQDGVADLIRRMDKRDGVSTRPQLHVVIARVSVLHTIEAILEPTTPLVRIHERDQLSAYELDEFPETRITDPSSITLTSVETYDTGGDDDARTTTSSPTSQCEDDGGNPDTSTMSVSPSGSPTAADDDPECDDSAASVSVQMPYKIGSSVYVHADKTNEYLAARVIGGSIKNGTTTVDVAYPSGIRRYHIPVTKVLPRRREEAFIFLVHRRVERSMNAFAEAHVTRLFGAPLTLRVSLHKTTNFDLYMLVWTRLHRIFNWKAPPSAETMDALLQKELSRAHDDNGFEQQQEQQQELRRTSLSTVALGRHLLYTKFGFCLRTVTSHGIGCSRCEWLDGCLGCVILPSPTSTISITAEEAIAIDWDIRTLKEEYDPIQASKLDTHESVQVNHKLDNKPLNIHRCLDMFTAQETISEAYCGRCKTHRPATKTMDLWRLPPLLVIQLKRFCFTQTSRRKLHHFVDFPLTGLRLEDFVAKKRDPKRLHETGLIYWQFLGGKMKNDAAGEQAAASSPVSESSRQVPVSSPSTASATATTLLDAPATAAQRADESFEYDLYAVVNHVGALGGGHYFAYVLSEEDNKWKCFNDHQCKDIDAKEVVSSSAYILFYRRRDMKEVAIEHLFPPIRRKPKKDKATDGGGVDVDDDSTVDEDQAKVEELVEQTKLATNGSNCVIS